MSTGQHFFEMAETGHHGDDVVLNIAQVQSNVHARRDLVIRVAPLGEALEDIGLATDETHQRDNIPARAAGALKKLGRIIITNHENRVFYRVYFHLHLLDDGEEAIDDVITTDGTVGVSARDSKEKAKMREVSLSTYIKA